MKGDNKLCQLEINTRYVKGHVLASGAVMQVEREKSEEQLSAELAEASCKAAIETGGRLAKLAAELTESEAIMRMAKHKFDLHQFEFEDSSKKWLTDARQFRLALDAEFRQATKSIADMVEYLARPEVAAAVRQMKELADVAERLKALNKDAAIERLMELLLKA